MGCCLRGSTEQPEDRDRRIVRIELEPLDSSSGGGDDDDTEFADIHFAQESVSDSVDDEGYYATYTTIAESDSAAPKSQITNRVLCVTLRLARLEAKRCARTPTQENLALMATMYDAAIQACVNPHVRKKIIREYESVRSRFPPTDPQRVRAAIKQAHDCVEAKNTRAAQIAYRRAIRLASDARQKREMKHEYNRFIVATRVAQDDVAVLV